MSMRRILQVREELNLMAGVIDLWLEKFWDHPMIYGWKADVDWRTLDRIIISARMLNEREYTAPDAKHGCEYFWLDSHEAVFHFTAYGYDSIQQFAKGAMKDEKSFLHRMIRRLCRRVSDHFTQYEPEAGSL